MAPAPFSATCTRSRSFHKNHRSGADTICGTTEGLSRRPLSLLYVVTTRKSNISANLCSGVDGISFLWGYFMTLTVFVFIVVHLYFLNQYVWSHQ